MKRIVSLTLTLVICLTAISGLMSVGASDGMLIQPFFVNISTMGVGCSISSDGKATCSGSFDFYNNNQYGEVLVQLQQYKNGSWVTLKSWSASGNGSGGISGDYYVVKGYSYRATTTITVYDSNNKVVETVTKNSTTRTY